MSVISEWDSMIDSRDILERIKEIEEEIETLTLTTPGQPTDELDEELADLQEVVSQCESIPDWEFGIVLINDAHFTEYAESLAYDLGLADEDESWPFNCIDWQAAAEELQVDYTNITFRGNDFWVRS